MEARYPHGHWEAAVVIPSKSNRRTIETRLPSFTVVSIALLTRASVALPLMPAAAPLRAVALPWR